MDSHTQSIRVDQIFQNQQGKAKIGYHGLTVVGATFYGGPMG